MRQLDKAITSLHHELAVMSGYIERSINNMTDVLFSRDPQLIEVVLSDDDLIDHAEKHIEQMCTCIIARHTPAAQDLREITAVFKIITDLERIGDHCSDIVMLVRDLGDEPYMKELVQIPEMMRSVKSMVKDSIDSYIMRDTSLAKEVYERDDYVDAIYKGIKEELIAIMEKDPSTVRQGLQLLLMAKYLERMADHATNVCEWIIYNVTGSRPKGDEDDDCCASME